MKIALEAVPAKGKPTAAKNMLGEAHKNMKWMKTEADRRGITVEELHEELNAAIESESGS